MTFKNSFPKRILLKIVEKWNEKPCNNEIMMKKKSFQNERIGLQIFIFAQKKV